MKKNKYLKLDENGSKFDNDTKNESSKLNNRKLSLNTKKIKFDSYVYWKNSWEYCMAFLKKNQIINFYDEPLKVIEFFLGILYKCIPNKIDINIFYVLILLNPNKNITNEVLFVCFDESDFISSDSSDEENSENGSVFFPKQKCYIIFNMDLFNKCIKYYFDAIKLYKNTKFDTGIVKLNKKNYYNFGKTTNKDNFEIKNFEALFIFAAHALAHIENYYTNGSSLYSTHNFKSNEFFFFKNIFKK